MFKYLNRGVSTPIAITIIVVLAIILVGGVLAYQYWWLPKEEVKPLEIEKQTIIPKDQTANWKTYRNEEYGFEIKYPKDANIRESNALLTVNLPFTSRTNLREKTFSMWVEPKTSQFCINARDSAYNPVIITIGGVEFLKGIDTTGGTETTARTLYYSTIKEDNCYIPIFSLAADKYTSLPSFNLNQESEIFNQMLSTFKFLERE